MKTCPSHLFQSPKKDTGIPPCSNTRIMARESSRPGHGHRHSSREPGSRQQHNKQKTSASEEGRSAGTSHMLSSDALAQLNRANARRSTQHVPVERRQGAKQGKKDRGREGERKRQRKRRAVSGAIVEEGRGSRGLGDLRGLRGGARSRGYDGLEKEDLYEGSEPQTRTNRKRLCSCIRRNLMSHPGWQLRD